MICNAARTGVVLVLCTAGCISCTRQALTTPRAAAPLASSRQVSNAVDAGDGDVELRALRQRAAANPQDLDARVMLARYYSRRGLPDLALEHYRLAARQFPGSAVVVLELAKLLREMREPEQALAVVRGYNSTNPGANWGTLSLEGIVLDEQGWLGEGEASHRAALALAPEQSALHNNLGYNLLSQGRLGDALKEFRCAIELDPGSKIAYNNLGTALASTGSSVPEEVLSKWERTNGPAVAHNNLAAALMEQGRWDEARAQVQESLRLRGDLSEALANLRLLAEQNQRPADRGDTAARK